jgi:hypothetical protein
MTRARLLPFLLLALAPAACTPDPVPPGRVVDLPFNEDSIYAAVQERGQAVMGVDQYTSQHVFEDLPAGGRIILERDDSADSTAIATIRAHMREIQADFTAGDFSKPFGVHAQQVPGTEVMAAQRALITYEVVDRPRGAALTITTRDSAALAAVHAFLAFQRMDHRAMGHEGHDGH